MNYLREKKNKEISCRNKRLERGRRGQRGKAKRLAYKMLDALVREHHQIGLNAFMARKQNSYIELRIQFGGTAGVREAVAMLPVPFTPLSDIGQ